MENPFSSLIGHDNVKQFLTRAFEKGQISHAYLFCGPENVGKTKAAVCFSAMLLSSCLTLENSLSSSGSSGIWQISKTSEFGPSETEQDDFQCLKNNPDFTLIEREINEKTQELNQNITINQIRALSNRIQITSFLGGRKVAVIKEADLMTLEAANAFLKNLEEPKGEAVIILLVNNLENLPETIISRCQIIYFHPVPSGIIKEHLIKLGAEPKKADLIISFAGSRPGLALQLLRNKDLLEFYKKQTELFLEFFNLPLFERLEKTRKIAIDTDKEKMYTILGIWMIAARRLMREKLDTAFIIERIHLAMRQIRANVNPSLAIENFIINLKN